jgi:hypothetical protein
MRPNDEITRFGRQRYASALSRMVTLSHLVGFRQDALAAIGSFAALSVLLPWEKRHMHEIGSFALCYIPATVVAGRRRHAFVAHHLLDGRQISAGVEELRYVGAPHVVRREWRYPRG